MSRKIILVIGIFTILSLAGYGIAYAGAEELPTWEEVFNPGSDFNYENRVYALEEFNNEMFAAVGVSGGGGGQLFRSVDGNNWTTATGRGFDLGVSNGWCGPDNYYDTMWDMIVFRSQLYILPSDNCAERPGQILRSPDGVTWEAVTADAFGLPAYFGYVPQFAKLAAFNGELYVSLYYFGETFDIITEVWHSATGDPGTWAKVMQFPGWWMNGDFHVFKGALYISSDFRFEVGTWAQLPEQVWRTFDGVNWEVVVSDGFGNSGSDALGGFADYKGYLYIGAGWTGTGGQIWRSESGDPGTWTPVELTGFGDTDNIRIESLVVYQGEIFASTENWVDGCNIYRSKDGIHWTAVNEPGWGNLVNVSTTKSADQLIFKDDLYIGMIVSDGVGIWKMVHPDN